MFNKALIYLIFTSLVVLSSSCFVKKNVVGTIGKSDLSGEELLIAVKNLNISESGFYIKKATINYSDQSNIYNFLVSIKHNESDQYLAVARTLTGFEVFRIFISRDTFLVNDRFSRRILTGENEYLELKYGLTNKLLALIFGDILLTENLKFISNVCVDGFMKFSNVSDNSNINGEIDCNYQKMRYVNIVNENMLQRVEFVFSDYKNLNSHAYPQKTEITSGQTKLIINIENIEFPWNEEIEFIPGENYKIQLLK